jgi:hypothetical protein
MTPISYPAYWKEPFFDKGPKYDKIKEIIDAVNAVNALEGELQVPGEIAVTIGGINGDGRRVYRTTATDGWFQINAPLPHKIKLQNGTYVYPQITSIRANWWQGNATAQLDRILVRKMRSDTSATINVLDDPTNRGAAGDNTYTWSSLTGRLDATYDMFKFLIYHIYDTAITNFKFMSCTIVYDYA